MTAVRSVAGINIDVFAAKTTRTMIARRAFLGGFDIMFAKLTAKVFVDNGKLFRKIYFGHLICSQHKIYFAEKHPQANLKLSSKSSR
jgi:hypothetical protein